MKRERLQRITGKASERKLAAIFDMIKNRTGFVYTFTDVLKYVCCHIKSIAPKPRSSKDASDTRRGCCFRCRKPSAKDYKFDKGHRRLMHELDITRLVLMLRNLRVIGRTVLEDRERAIIKN